MERPSVSRVLCSSLRREAKLPRYYFHLYNDEVLHDQTGECHADVAAARQAATHSISELIAEHIVAGKLVDLRHRIDVEDSSGAAVATVKFGDFFVAEDGAVSAG